MTNEELKQMESIELVESLINDLSLADKFDELNLWDSLNSWDWCELLSACPQFEDKCKSWEDFDTFDWCHLIAKQPQFSEKCDCWDSFVAGDWMTLLREQPKFADKCPEWDKYNTLFFVHLGIDIWGQIIEMYPHLPMHNKTYAKLEKIMKDRSISLISQEIVNDPSLAEWYDHFDLWNAIPPTLWIDVLKAHPQFFDKCNEVKNFDGYIWEQILLKQPQLAEWCDKWHEMNPSVLKEIVEKNPEINDVMERQQAEFPMSVFVRTKSDEDIYNELKDNADEDSQTALCKVFGEGAFPYAYMKEASKFICKYIWMAVEKEDSSACNFIYNFINAFMLSGDCDYKDLRNAFYRELMSFVNWYPSESEEILWRAIPDFATRKLIKNPDLADECLCFNLFKGHHWCALLSAQPQFSELAEKYDGFKKLIYYHDEMEDGSWHSGYTEILSYWSNLLQAQPSFKEKCKEYNGFADFCSQSPDPLPRESLKCLTTAEPRRIQLVGYDDDELEAHYKGENGWVELLKSTKEFDKEFEEYQAYYSLMEDDWDDLLKSRPELAKFKPVERNLEIYPCFDFEDSAHCENDEWNENAVGDYKKVDFDTFFVDEDAN